MEACEPIHHGGFKHDGEVVCHDVGVAATDLHGGGIAHEPLLGVGVTIVLLNTEEFEVRGPLYSL